MELIESLYGELRAPVVDDGEGGGGARGSNYARAPGLNPPPSKAESILSSRSAIEAQVCPFF